MPTLFLYSITDTENLSPDLGPSASGIRLALYMPGSPKAGSLLETALARAALSFWGCRVASHAYVSDKRLRRESGDMIRSAVSSVREAAELAGFPIVERRVNEDVDVAGVFLLFVPAAHVPALFQLTLDVGGGEQHQVFVGVFAQISHDILLSYSVCQISMRGRVFCRVRTAAGRTACVI